MTLHFKYVCCGGLWKPIVGTSLKLNRNPKSEEVGGKQAGNHEVAQFPFPCLSCFKSKFASPNYNPISAYLESPTNLRQCAAELHKCDHCEGAHNARESKQGKYKLQLVNYRKQSLPHRIANSVGAH